jgi:hypothetical protein
LIPGGSSIHLQTNSTQTTENETHTKITRKTNSYKGKTQLQGKNWDVNWEVRAVTRLCELYPGICLTIEEKARKNLT